MRVAFRADASHRIGTGHVMRCLTLAEELRRRGDEVAFVSRAHPGYLFAQIEAAGFSLLPLEAPRALDPGADASNYAAWLGVDQVTDAAGTFDRLGSIGPLDWLVVDHYALDHVWEERLRPHAGAIAVLDDLANRRHDADLLLDPTLAREPSDYHGLVPANARTLLGPTYAPLRAEFAALRPEALARRCETGLPPRLLVNLGGADADGATVTTLIGLAEAELPEALEIEIVLGANAVDPAAVRRVAETLAWPAEVAVGVSDLAARMARADLAIGAAGTTSWERCCLGLPTLVITIADNQRGIARALERAGAIRWLGDHAEVLRRPECVGEFVLDLLNDGARYAAMSRAASRITDGYGGRRLVDALHGVAQVDDNGVFQ